jgi:N-acetylglucosaminyl-diphospho-decaprenol L-rhamnosyltransferase
MIDISIIIVNYKVKEYIIPCIQSIIDFSSIKYTTEIIVVDNNSRDGSLEQIRKSFPNVQLIKNKTNQGFTKAANIGAKNSNGRYLFFLNPDTYLIDDSIALMFDFMKKNKNIAVIGPAMYSPKNRIQQSFWRKPTLLNTIFSLIYLDFLNIKKNYSHESNKTTKEVESISGGAFFVRLSTFKSLEGFDEDLFWMEDIDFCLRTFDLGYKIYYYPDAKIIHYIGKSSDKNWKVAIYNQLSSKINFFKKHCSKIEVISIKYIILVISLIKLFFLILLSPFKNKFRKKIPGYKLIIKDVLN